MHLHCNVNIGRCSLDLMGRWICIYNFQFFYYHWLVGTSRLHSKQNETNTKNKVGNNFRYHLNPKPCCKDQTTPRMNFQPLGFLLLTSHELPRSSGARPRDFWGEVRLAGMVMLGLNLYSLSKLKFGAHINSSRASEEWWGEIWGRSSPGAPGKIMSTWSVITSTFPGNSKV